MDFALWLVFPNADPRNLEACFAASDPDFHATVQAYRVQQARDALVSRLARAAWVDNGADECAGVLVEQMVSATGVANAKNRASWILGLIKNAVADREENNAVKREAAAEAVRLREENADLREQAVALEHDKAVLKCGVLVQLPGRRRLRETANYALSVRLRDADGCRFQVYRGPGSDVF